MSRRGYELTEQEWELLCPLISLGKSGPGKGGRPRADDRQMLNGMIWIWTWQRCRRMKNGIRIAPLCKRSGVPREPHKKRRSDRRMNPKVMPRNAAGAVGGPKSMGFVMEQETDWDGWSVPDQSADISYAE